MEDVVVEGPAVRSLTGYWAGDPKGQWALDAGWFGVRVAEKPLLEGEQVVIVAIDPGARCVVGSTHAGGKSASPMWSACAVHM